MQRRWTIGIGCVLALIGAGCESDYAHNNATTSTPGSSTTDSGSAQDIPNPDGGSVGDNDAPRVDGVRFSLENGLGVPIYLQVNHRRSWLQLHTSEAVHHHEEHCGCDCDDASPGVVTLEPEQSHQLIWDRVTPHTIASASQACDDEPKPSEESVLMATFCWGQSINDEGSRVQGARCTTESFTYTQGQTISYRVTEGPTMQFVLANNSVDPIYVQTNVGDGLGTDGWYTVTDDNGEVHIQEPCWDAPPCPGVAANFNACGAYPAEALLLPPPRGLISRTWDGIRWERFGSCMAPVRRDEGAYAVTLCGGEIQDPYPINPDEPERVADFIQNPTCHEIQVELGVDEEARFEVR